MFSRLSPSRCNSPPDDWPSRSNSLANDQQTRAESKAEFVEQVNLCLHAGNYSRALDLLRNTAHAFPNDAELSDLEKLAQDGVQRNAEAQRLITESQELFARQKSAEAIQLLRNAYALDKNNSLARSILANALVEHAHSLLETDWLEAEKLSNQALALNPVHPTAKTVLGLILELKKTSSAEDWVAQARKLQSSGDLFAALAWVAEGLAVHPHEPKLLQIQDAIQRDQAAQRRHARRRDMEDLRVMEAEINRATDPAAKQALAERIQALAAKYWTDGAMLTVANSLLQRLGVAPPENSSASPRSKNATVIFHVPRSSAPKPSPVGQIPPTKIPPSPIPLKKITPSQTLQSVVSSGNVPTAIVPPSQVDPSKVVPSEASPSIAPASQILPSTVPPREVVTAPSVPEPQAPSPQAGVAASGPSVPTIKVTSSSQPESRPRSNLTSMILVSAAVAIIAVAATLFFARKHYAPPLAQTQSVAPTVAAPTASAPATTDSVPAPSAPGASTPTTPAQSTPEPSLAAAPHSTNAAAKVTPNNQRSDVRQSDVQLLHDQPSAVPPPAESGHNLGALLVVAGQDNAQVFLNGKLQPRLTQSGQLRIPNLDLKDYVVQVSKAGFQDPPQQQIHIRNGQEVRLVFTLQPQPQPQPQPRLASLTIRGGAPGTTVFLDQTAIGTIQPDGTLSVSTVNPGDHTVELRKDRFKPRQLREHFLAGAAIFLTAADTALEAAPGELKITFTPANANVAIVNGNHLTLVNSGVPVSLAAGTYTLTTRTADGFRSSSTLEVVAGQSRTFDLSLAPNGMSRWDDPAAWKQDKDSFIRKGGDFVLYGVVPASGTFSFSAMPAKGHLLQWVVNYTDPKNYVLFQFDDNNFYRTVIRNAQKTDEIKIPDKGDKKTFRTLHIRVSPTEIVHQIKHGDSWTILDRWTQPGTNLATGKFGFYIPGDDEVSLSNFAHYADLNLR